jgi:hypothetical protein
MAPSRFRRPRAVLTRVVRHRWACVALALLAIGLLGSQVPVSRTYSTSFDLSPDSGPSYPGPPLLASACLPGDSHVSMAWTATDVLPGFAIVIEAPNGTTWNVTGSTGSTSFGSAGGSFYFTAEDVSSPSGSVQVHLSWKERGTIGHLYVGPQPRCTLL